MAINAGLLVERSVFAIVCVQPIVNCSPTDLCMHGAVATQSIYTHYSVHIYTYICLVPT